MLVELWSVWDGNNLLSVFDSEKKAEESIEEWSEKLNIDESAIYVTSDVFDNPRGSELWFTLVDGVIEDLWASEIDAIDDKNRMINSRIYDDCTITIDKIAIK